MAPVNRPEVSDVYIWSQIQYLDPDYEEFLKQIGNTRTKHSRRNRIIAMVLSLTALAGALVAWHFHLVARLMN